MEHGTHEQEKENPGFLSHCNRGFFANQFEILANFKAHFEGTKPEIWEQTGGNLDAFILHCYRLVLETLMRIRSNSPLLFLREFDHDYKACIKQGKFSYVGEVYLAFLNFSTAIAFGMGMNFF